MLTEKIKKFHIILASSSPRRQELLKQMGISFKVRSMDVDEIYPDDLQGSEISDYLAKLKADAYAGQLGEKEILISSDTIVWHNEKSLAKPVDKEEAFLMLKTLSDDTHEVITSVCFTTANDQIVEHAITKVRFRKLADEEIHYYINAYEPFDKAGAYGIQEWLGLIGIEEIKGSYSNVVGLPTHLVLQTLQQIVK